jgi:hypothetical protein
LIKQEPDIDQISKLKPANDGYLELVGNSFQQQEQLSQHQQGFPEMQTMPTAYEEFQKQQQLLVQQYQDQMKAQLLLHQQLFEQQQQQLLSSQQQTGSNEVLQSVSSLKPHKDLKIKTKPGVESTTETYNSSLCLVHKSGLDPVTLPTVSSTLSVPKSRLEATSASSLNDLNPIASIKKTTVLSGLVREYIDSQRGILEIYQVGHSELLMEPIAGNLNISKIQGWLSFIVFFLLMEVSSVNQSKNQ